jgi:uncharacterized protein (DUF2141 family)
MGAAALMIVLLPGSVPVGQLDVRLDGLRSTRGMIRICLTRRAASFPDCIGDPEAITRTVPAADRGFSFPAVPDGGYALALIHDENSNARLDTFAGIPREGVGFSRNPHLMFGPPRFSAAEFPIIGGVSHQTIRMKYFL